MVVARYLLIVICVMLLSASSGCQRKASRPIGVVRGRVTVAGQPVTGGTIIFENASLGVSTSGTIEPDGNYVVRTYIENGLPVGKYQVSVSPRQYVSDGIDIVGQNAAKAAAPLAIPTQYQTIGTTPLKADVHEGDNPAFDFDLSNNK